MILVGGLGTRLKASVDNLPKPMAPVKGFPFLLYKMMNLKNHGITKFILCVSYKKDEIIKFFGDGEKFGINIEYSIEETPLGTGGAIKKASKFIKHFNYFFVTHGDTYIDLTCLEEIKKIHFRKLSHPHNIILTTYSRKPGQEGVVVCDLETRKVLGFKEKPKDPKPNDEINTAFMLLNTRIFSKIIDCEFVSLEKHILPHIIYSEDFYSFYSDRFFIDIGDPESYNKFILKEIYNISMKESLKK